MHVGLNLVFLTPGEQGGMETYVRELIPELIAVAPEHRFTAFINRDAARSSGPWNELASSVVIPVQPRQRVQWVRGEQQLLPPLARRARVDVLHSLASTSPCWGAFRRVVTIHDLIYRHVPDAHPGLRSLGMRVLVPLAARSSNRIIADSRSTAHDLETMLGIPSHKIDVVPLGLGASIRAQPLTELEIRTWLQAGDRPIVLSVSAKLAHKNLGRLISAIGTLDLPERPLLVLPGYPTAHERELREIATRLGVTDDVRFLGWVSPEQLEGLYSAAACCVLPSLVEGFGLPALEAMVRGVPVACSGRGALAEVTGEAALHFDPGSEKEIAAVIRRLVRDTAEAARLRDLGHTRAAGFSWRQTALNTLAVYERVFP